MQQDDKHRCGAVPSPPARVGAAVLLCGGAAVCARLHLHWGKDDSRGPTAVDSPPEGLSNGLSREHGGCGVPRGRGVAHAVAAAHFLFAVTGAWWFLAAARHHGFAVLAGRDMLPGRFDGDNGSSPIPRAFQSIDMFIPRWDRVVWAATTLAGAVAVLIYYTAALKIAHMRVDEACPDSVVLSSTFQGAGVELSAAVLTDGYAHVLAAQPGSLAAMDATAASVAVGSSTTAFYPFVGEAARDAMVTGIAALHGQLAGLDGLAAVQSAALVAAGVGTHESLFVVEYERFTERQGFILSTSRALYETVGLCLTRVEAGSTEGRAALASPESRAAFVTVLQRLTKWRDGPTQLFALDHVAAASFLVFTSETLATPAGSTDGQHQQWDEGAANAFWPFLAYTGNAINATAAEERAARLVRLAGALLTAAAADGAAFTAAATATMGASAEILAAVRQSLRRVHGAIPDVVALFTSIPAADRRRAAHLFDPSAGLDGLWPEPRRGMREVWRAQRCRALDISHRTNHSALAALAEAHAAAVAALEAAAVSSFTPAVGHDVVSRKTVQLQRALTIGLSVESLERRAPWEGTGRPPSRAPSPPLPLRYRWCSSRCGLRRVPLCLLCCGHGCACGSQRRRRGQWIRAGVVAIPTMVPVLLAATTLVTNTNTTMAWTTMTMMATKRGKHTVSTAAGRAGIASQRTPPAATTTPTIDRNCRAGAASTERPCIAGVAVAMLKTGRITTTTSTTTKRTTTAQAAEARGRRRRRPQQQPSRTTTSDGRRSPATGTTPKHTMMIMSMTMMMMERMVVVVVGDQVATTAASPSSRPPTPSLAVDSGMAAAPPSPPPSRGCTAARPLKVFVAVSALIAVPFGLGFHVTRRATDRLDRRNGLAAAGP